MPNPTLLSCVNCMTEGDQSSVVASTLTLASGAAPALQARVAVSGNNVPILPSATYQSVFIKNTGTAVVWIRTDSNATTGSNGEIPLEPETVAGSGNGGSITIETIIGAITAACATSSSVSVTWST